jgi:hypothetical protein
MRLWHRPRFVSRPSPLSIGALVFAAVVLAGCSSNKEEQDFYERGWLWPRSLDRPDRPVRPAEETPATESSW